MTNWMISFYEIFIVGGIKVKGVIIATFGHILTNIDIISIKLLALLWEFGESNGVPFLTTF